MKNDRINDNKITNNIIFTILIFFKEMLIFENIFVIISNNNHAKNENV